MDLEETGEEKVFITIEHSRQGEWTLWSKFKHKEDAEECVAHLPD